MRSDNCFTNKRFELLYGRCFGVICHRNAMMLPKNKRQNQWIRRRKQRTGLLGKFLAVTTELKTNNGRAARYCYVQDF